MKNDHHGGVIGMFTLTLLPRGKGFRIRSLVGVVVPLDESRAPPLDHLAIRSQKADDSPHRRISPRTPRGPLVTPH